MCFSIFERSRLAKVTDLATARASREATTSLAAWLARTTGAKILSQRPGHITATLPDDEAVVEVRVRQKNPFQLEAEAYRQAGKPVPSQVEHDLECWEQEHGKR